MLVLRGGRAMTNIYVRESPRCLFVRPARLFRPLRFVPTTTWQCPYRDYEARPIKFTKVALEPYLVIRQWGH